MTADQFILSVRELLADYDAPPLVSKLPFGMNLAGVADWSTEFPFADAFKSSRPWSSQREGSAKYGDGPALTLDANGWPLRLDPGCFAEAMVYVDMPGHYPTAPLYCTWIGNGRVEFSGAAAGSLTEPGWINLKPDAGYLAVRIRETNPADPVRRVQLIRQGPISTFRREFLDRYRGYKALRFMDWLRTNNSNLSRWFDRPLTQDSTQASNKGVALEHCIDLANETGIDPWLNVPHQADDDYIRQMAALVKSRLAPDRKVYVEYSNETWNAIFEQAKYCRMVGLSLRLATDPYEAQIRYAARRSRYVFAAFVNELGKDRVVRVVAGHADDIRTGQWLLDNPTPNAPNANAIAIAPYWGHGDQIGDVTQMTVDQILDKCLTLVDRNRERIEAYAKLAKEKGVRLIAYEGGQHLTAGVGEGWLDKFTAANRHPRMRELYLRDLRQWQALGGDLFAVFSSCCKYGPAGAWGVREWDDQVASPKLDAIRELM